MSAQSAQTKLVFPQTYTRTLYFKSFSIPIRIEHDEKRGHDVVIGTFEDGTEAVAVLYSPGYGGGYASAAWCSCRDNKLIDLFVTHSSIIHYVIFSNEKTEEGFNQLLDSLNIEQNNRPYVSGIIRDASLAFVPRGGLYQIDEYDGAESVVVFNPNAWMTA
jgi:hypothetical protein